MFAFWTDIYKLFLFIGVILVILLGLDFMGILTGPMPDHSIEKKVYLVGAISSCFLIELTPIVWTVLAPS